MSRKPNFLCIGATRSGSTWVYAALRQHPEVFLPDVKELHYFDYYYHLGPEWYYKHFDRAKPSHRIVGEITPDYLYSEEACERIASDLGDIKILVSLRNPVERTHSSYLYLLRLGFTKGTFEQAMQEHPMIVEQSLYGKQLLWYKKKFGGDNILVKDFQKIKTEPDPFFLQLCRDLGIEEKLPEGMNRGKVNESLAPRNFKMARIAKRISNMMLNRGLSGIAAEIKAQSWIQRALYRPYKPGTEPKIDPKTAARLKAYFADDVRLLDREFNQSFAKVWGYDDAVIAP